MAIAGLLPWIGDDVDAVSTLTGAAEDAATGGGSVVVAARSAGWGGSVELLGAGGQVDLAALERAGPGLDAAATDLQGASDAVSGIETQELIGRLAAIVTEADETLTRQSELVGKARDLAHVLPGMLGADGPKRYLLAFQNLSAPHGTGGYLGFLGELSAVDGRLSLEDLEPVGDVQPVPPVDVPPDVRRRYGRFGVATTMWASNYPPDVAESSDIASQIWLASGRKPVDGVLWADTIFMSDMLAAIGPVESRAWPEPITVDNVVEVLNRNVFELAGQDRSDAIQARVGSDMWTAALTRRPDPSALGEAVASGTREGHLAMFSTDADAQRTLERLGAAGRFVLGDHPLAVVWQDASASRAGYFAEHEVASTVTLGADGAATTETVVTLHNAAPDGPPSILLGDGKGHPVGWWGVDVEVYLPADAEAPDVVTSEPSIVGIDEAYGHPVADARLFAESGDTMSLTVTYAEPGAASRAEDDTWSYAVQLRPRPMLRAVPYSLNVALPEGAEVVTMPEGATYADGSVRWSGTPTEPVGLQINYRLPG
jgi:hypothetical protein